MTTDSNPARTDDTPDVLRVQAAAVAAQQAALTEQELQMRERQASLEQQERQLAALLEEKRLQVVALQDQLSGGRDQLRRERADLDAMRDETTSAHREAVAERERLRGLRVRFVQRWKRHWVGERRTLQAQTGTVERAAKRLQKDRAAFDQFRQKFHGDAELEKRRLQEEWRALTEEQSRLQEDRRQFNADMARWETQYNERVQTLRQIAQKFIQERQVAEQHCDALRAEARGLETRISNQRRVLVEQERQRTIVPIIPVPMPAALDPIPAVALPPDVEAAFAAREQFFRKQQAALERQATELSDQRLHLAELCERLANAQSGWHQSRGEYVGELEQLTGHIVNRDESLRVRSRDLHANSDRLRQERDAVGRLRRDLEQKLTDLTARQHAWQNDRHRLLAELNGRERDAERRERALAVLFRRWRDRRVAEVAELRNTLQAALQERAEWVKQRDEWRHRSQALRDAMQAIAEQSLALEESRQEFLRETDRPQAAEKRLVRLRRRYEGLTAAARRGLDKRRADLDATEARLEQSLRELGERMTVQTQRERELADERNEAEAQRLRFEEENGRLETERAVWREQRHHYDRQLAQMRDEVERVARLLIDDEVEERLEPLAA